MKRIIFSIVASMLISLCALQAQQQRTDTTGTASKTRTQQQNRQRSEQSRQQHDQRSHQRDQSRQQGGQEWQQQSDKNQNGNAYASEGMVIIQKDELPSSVKQSLQDQKYAGWENATIYHNTNTGEYVIAPRAYRFDKQGKEMEMGDAGDAYGNRQGRYSSGDKNNQYQSQDGTQGQNQSGYSDRSATDRSSTQGQQPSSGYQTNPSQGNRDQSQQSTNDQSGDQSRSSTGDQSQTDRQQPSSSYRTDQSNQSSTSGQSRTGDQASTSDQSRNGQNQYSQEQVDTENMTEIQAEQVPASLRRTLKGSQYSGWEENGKLYQDPATSEYVLVMQQTNGATQPRSYRFDKNGQMKQDETGTSRNKQ
jgi:hypothetical protein